LQCAAVAPRDVQLRAGQSIVLSRKSAFLRNTVVALAAGALVLISIIGSTLYLVHETRNYSDQVMASRRVRSSTADLLLMIQQAESGQRGYLLTRDADFLSIYREGAAKLRDRQAQFEQVLRDNPFFKLDMTELQKAIAAKAAELDQTIELASTGRPDEALRIVKSRVGFEQMVKVNDLLEGLIQTADERVATQIASQVRMANILRVATIAGAVAIGLLLAGAVFIISRYVREIQSAQKELQVLNAGLEDRVQERTEDLMQANQEIQRYAYIVTHDLRAPLVNIMGFTAELEGALTAIQRLIDAPETGPSEEVLSQARLAAKDDLPEAIGFIRSSTRKMDGLINAILKISRDGRRPLQPEPIDLEAVVKASGDAIQHQIAEADGELDISVNVPGFVSDRFSIEQIVGNLFDNAVKYRDPNRPLRLAVKAFPLNRLKIGIDVIDNGRGIAPEDHDRVFDLFRRSGVQDKAGEGIGLAQVRSLVRNMGGEIKVRSELGKGTTFMIRLPTDLSQFVRNVGE
jgi:signal transduction histidine kinase